MEIEKKVYYPEDLAKATGLGINLIYRELREGKIPHIRAGDRYLISRDNFEKWVNGESAKKETEERK